MNSLRSLLFVPANRPRMLDKARGLAAEAVILDLEDAVPLGQKSDARVLAGEALKTGGFGPQLCVRINAPYTGLSELDLEAVIQPALQAICLPKAEMPDEIREVSNLILSLEQQRGMSAGSISLLLLVETALGVVNAYALASASERVRALCLGGEDLCSDLGAVRTQAGLELAYARAHLVTAARAAGVQAIDTVFTTLEDTDGLLAEARHARQLGYDGKLLIHPCQIAPTHEAFAPTEAEITVAQRLVEQYEAAVERGQGAISVDGKMIDAPIVARARRILSHLGNSGS